MVKRHHLAAATAKESAPRITKVALRRLLLTRTCLWMINIVADNSPQPSREESLVGNVIIAVLACVVLVLLGTCSLLWAQAQDVALQAHVRARIQTLKAEYEAAEAKHEAALLRKRIVELEDRYERKTSGTTSAPDL